MQKTKPARCDAERTGYPGHWLPLHIALLWKRLIPVARFVVHLWPALCCWLDLSEEIFQLAVRKNNHAALPSSSHLPFLCCLGFDTRPARSHLCSCTKGLKQRSIFWSVIFLSIWEITSVLGVNIPGGVTSISWLGRKETDLKVCQWQLLHFQKKNSYVCQSWWFWESLHDSGIFPLFTWDLKGLGFGWADMIDIMVLTKSFKKYMQR